MIDIETLDTSPTSSVITIGAVKFDLSDLDHETYAPENEDVFYNRISRKSCKKYNLTESQSTLVWWVNRPSEEKKELFDKTLERYDLPKALKNLSEFIKGCKDIWMQSPNFDAVILENAYKLCGIEIPWKFWNLRDTRTIYSLIDLPAYKLPYKNKNHHNAKHDCITQIRNLLYCMEMIHIIEIIE